MSKWTLSLTDLANQAEAFLEQVDKKAADSLQEENSGDEEDTNFFSNLSSSISILPEANYEPSENMFGGSEGSYSSPEVLAPAQDIMSVSGSDISLDSTKPGEVEETRERLELENKLVKQEITLLTEEIGMLSSKLRSYQEKWESAEKQAEKLKSTEEELVKQAVLVGTLEERESDLNEALAAKDTQIGVLKVRLAEADAELLAQAARSKNQEVELKVRSSCYTELRELQGTVESCNDQLQECRDRLNKTQSEGREREGDLQAEITRLTGTLHHTEQTLNAEKRKYNSAISEVKLTKNELGSARKDLADYKDRATRVLQARERRCSTAAAILDTEAVEVLIQERNLVESQLRSTRSEIEVMKEHLNSMEQVHTEELQEALEKCSMLECLGREKDTGMSVYQTTVSQLKEEVFVVQRELAALRSSSAASLRVLRAKLAEGVESGAANTGPGQGELEVKIRSLTEVLLIKQAEVEQLNSERGSLVMRLESLETVLQTVERKNNSVSIPVEREGFVEQKTTVYKNQRLRDALNSIDKFSIRLGVFLRRYPQARLMVIGYMFLLHGWVMVVLLTYTPEIHNH